MITQFVEQNRQHKVLTSLPDAEATLLLTATSSSSKHSAQSLCTKVSGSVILKFSLSSDWDNLQLPCRFDPVLQQLSFPINLKAFTRENEELEIA
mmetsp:Transcript_10044/g.16916  ORF Transcript_10044/g.16916 Transcript_10044/m.16916 type:complete len:95 (+) Transcript_10044:356-640(+)